MLEASRGARRIRRAIVSIVAADLAPRVGELQAPLGLMWGERDRVVPVKTLDMLREVAPDAAIETIAESGHIPHLEYPEKFAATLDRLLARLRPVTA